MGPYFVSASELDTLLCDFNSTVINTNQSEILSYSQNNPIGGLTEPENEKRNVSDLVALPEALKMLANHQALTFDESYTISKRKLRKGSTRLIFSALQNCKTLEEALVSLAESYNILHGGEFNLVIKKGDTISYVVDDKNFHYQIEAVPLAIELALLGIHCTLSYLCGRPLKTTRVGSKRKNQPEYKHHLDIFSCELEFSRRQYELSYEISQASLDIRLQSVEDIIDVQKNYYEYFIKLVRNEDKANFLRHCKGKLLTASAKYVLVEQEYIAKCLDISVATLRRRLREYGSSFREIRDECNNAIACKFLLRGWEINKISEQLGYSDVRSFTRAFKRWQGVSPSVYAKVSAVKKD